jgi:hypothetical protein
LSAGSAQAAPQENTAKVRAVRGSANYSTDRGANWKTLKVGASLKQNSVIRTAPGSSVDLFLNENGPTVRVTENTTMGIDRLTIDRTGGDNVIETQLDLRAGRILGNVRPLAAASKYEVKTPQGVAGIRGTKYDISADGTVKVVEGQIVVVYILSDGTAKTATVNAGQTARPPTAPTQDVPLVPIPTVDANRINDEIESIPTGPGTPTGGEGPVPIVTPTPVTDAPVEGDPANTPDVVETPIRPD